MKRKVWFILLVFAFFTIPVFSEEENIQSSYEVETPDGEVGELKVYKLLKWKKEVNSVKYRVQIEKDNNGTWESVYDAEHEETSIEVALTPGRHRVAITGMNIIGRLGKQEPKWRETVVITDDQPYLDSKYMKKNPDWNYPVLMVTQAEDEVVTDVVIPEAGDPENSFSVKGKNIFFPDKKFYLEPEDKPSKGGKEFLAYNKLRVSVPLEVIRNDHENNSVVLKYNGDKLNTGYYQIVAENRGGKKSALDILVFANRSPVLDTKSFTYYPNYEVNLFDAQKVNEEGILKLYGTGYTSDTEYSLTPSTAGIPYPFATMTERETIPLTVASSRTFDYVGNMEISLSVPQKIRPGYYNISAQNKLGSDSKLVLVKDLDQQITSPLINSISAEVTKKSEYITITLKGKEISANTVYSIVSQFSEETGNNLHIPLTVVDLKRGGKKVILQGKKEKLTEGDYGLLIETPSNSFVKYFHINPKFKTSFVTLSDDETVEKFIRPENFVAVVKTVQEDGTEIVEEVKSVVTENELEYSPFDFKVLRKSKMLVP